MNVRSVILKIHFYGGLACFWYLILLGISSLQFNHHFSYLEKQQEPIVWTRLIHATYDSAKELALSETLRDSLSLIGWPLPWETTMDSLGNFHFSVEQPAKRYVIDYSFATHEAKVTETAKGFWRLVNALHGSGAVPGAPLMKLWSWYTRLTVVFVVFSIFSGIYLWFVGQRDKKSGTYLLVIATSIAVSWMLHMYLNG